MRAGLSLAALLLMTGPASAQMAEAPPAPREEVQSELSTREISIQSNFTGIEILIYGSVDFSQTKAPDQGVYDVIIVIRSPSLPLVARRKERAPDQSGSTRRAGSSVRARASMPRCRPVRSGRSRLTKPSRQLGVGLANVDFGRHSQGDPDEETFRSAVIRLKEKQELFQEHDDGVVFIGRSLFRATVDLPVHVPTGRYTADVFLFRDGQLVSKNQSTLEVNKAGFEQMVYRLAFSHPLFMGCSRW